MAYVLFITDGKFLFEGKSDNYGLYEIVSREDLFDPKNELLVDDRLTLYCEVMLQLD